MIDYDFRQINFGLSDAQTEGEDYPNLLSDGYVDILQVVDKALEDYDINLRKHSIKYNCQFD